ncbi:MAG: hypothetical protein GF398_17610 [Chitinivibrionales bacterium]|nr:hypothetical protein [Chitinivibrionales bacterium]
MRKITCLQLVLFVTFAVHFSSAALTIDLIPVLPAVMTNAHVSQFDLFGTGIGPLMFMVHINNFGDTATYTSLRVRYIVHYESKVAQTGGRQLIYEGITYPFDVKPGENFIIRSNDFLKDDNFNVRASITSTIYELDDYDLKKRIATSQNMPDGTIYFKLQLESNNATINSDNSDHVIINATYVELITPGSETGSEISIVNQQNPVFIWNSDLFPLDVNLGDIFEISIYEGDDGEQVGDITSRPPIRQALVATNQYQYPVTGAQLEKGKVYVWEVAAKIKGSSLSNLKSPLYRFKRYKPANPYVNQIIQTLRQVYPEEVLQPLYGYDDDAEIIIDGKRTSLAELQQIVARINAGTYDIEHVEVRK